MGDNKPQSARIEANALDAGAAIRAADRDAGWPAADWWRAYRDPQLDAWIANAQAGNPTLAAAEARVREAQAMARVARSAELPQINGNLSLMRQHWPDNVYYGPGPLANTDTWNNTGTLGLSYHLDLWGKDKNATERALDTAHATAADARAAKLELEVNVVRAYVGMSMNYALLDLAHETFERQRSLADLARKRLQAGLGTQLEVSQAESTLPDYERQIDSYEEAIQLARHQLAALAGKRPGAGDAIKRPQLSLDAPAGLPSAMPADLLGRRPDVVAARWTVDAQARGIDVAKASFYPNIDLLATVGGFGVTAPFTDFLRAMNGGWTAGPRCRCRSSKAAGCVRSSAPRMPATTRRSSATTRRSSARSRTSPTAVVRIRSLDTQKKDAARSVAANDRSYQLSREGFRRGLTDYVNVLVAQQQLLRAQETAARIDAERLAAHAQLMAALGGGVETGTDVRGGHPSHDESAAGAAAPAAASGAKPVAAVARPAQVAAAGASGVPAAR